METKDEKIEIYSSKKKSLLILIGSLLFVIGGIYMFFNPEGSSRSPLFVRTVGLVSALFFGIAIFISVKQLIKNKLILTIDKKGIHVNPRKFNECIEWKNITGFSELKIKSQKFVIIEVDNSDYWIKKESGLRKKLMEFNVNNYGSPFNLSANSMQINFTELVKILNENLNKYKV